MEARRVPKGFGIKPCPPCWGYKSILKEIENMKYTLEEVLRNTIGLDPTLFAAQTQIGTGLQSLGYPPYDIEKVGEDEYQVTLAVAGFTPEEMTVTSVESSLEIIGEKKAIKDSEERTFLHRGIAPRKFKHTFTLADYVRVVSAKTENGLLIIDLLREVPESQKPRTIEIKSA